MPSTSPTELHFSPRILYLSQNPACVRAVLAGDQLPLAAAQPLRDEVSTDEITPIAILTLPSPTDWILLTVIWSVALLGIAFRVFWIYTFFRAFHTPECLFVSNPISWILTLAAQMIAYFLICRKYPKEDCT